MWRFHMQMALNEDVSSVFEEKRDGNDGVHLFFKVPDPCGAALSDSLQAPNRSVRGPRSRKTGENMGFADSSVSKPSIESIIEARNSLCDHVIGVPRRDLPRVLPQESAAWQQRAVRGHA